MLVLTLLVASFAIYGSLSIAPGNPLSVLTGGRTLPPEAMATLRVRYHLDEPLPAQYWHWLTSALHGDLGTSIALRESVNTLIGERAGVTVELVLYAAVLILVLGIGSGIVAGLRRGSRQIAQVSCSETLPHTLQKRTLSRTTIRISARRVVSKLSVWRMWNAMRCADFGPIPGRRPSSSIRSWTMPSYTG